MQSNIFTVSASCLLKSFNCMSSDKDCKKSFYLRLACDYILFHIFYLQLFKVGLVKIRKWIIFLNHDTILQTLEIYNTQYRKQNQFDY